MEKSNLEGYLQDILEKVKKVVEENDQEAINELTSYIHISKDLIRYYQLSEGEDEAAEKAYNKIKEAEEKVSKLSRTNHIATSSFDLKDILKVFLATIKEISGA